MRNNLKSVSIYKTEGRFWLSALLTLPVAFVLFVMLTQGADVFSMADRRFAYTVVWFADVFLFFQLLYSGKTDRWRAPLFIVFAAALSLTFVVNIIELRGTMSFDQADLLQCKTPYCHIVTTMILIPAALSKSIIFPGSINSGFAAISHMMVLTIGAVLVLGRGFCSWVCFYGGWDDGFSRIRKRAVIRKTPAYLRWGGFAVLIVVALTSAATLIPTYCDWICPFKAVTEFEAVSSFRTGLKTVVFAGLFSGLVVALPIMTRKRTQCAWFCPMGALCSLSNPINVYGVRIDREKCIRCGKCIRECPVQALDSTALEKGRANLNCVKCGRCADVCPKQSIGFHIRWTRVLKHPTISRLIFLYTAFGFMAIFSGGILQQTVLILLRLFATGRVLS